MRIRLKLDAGRIYAAHLGAIAALAALYVLTTAASLATGRDNLLGSVPMFNLDAEFNAPALFSAAALAFAAALAWVTGSLGGPAARAAGRPWRALGGVLAFLSLDEALHLHEKLGIQLDLLHMAGQNYSWLVPYALAAASSAAVFLRFLLALPAPTRRALIVAGAVFVGGAAGMEFVGGRVADAYGQVSIAYRATILVEELAEMLGIALFIRATLEYGTRLQLESEHDLVGDALAARDTLPAGEPRDRDYAGSAAGEDAAGEDSEAGVAPSDPAPLRRRSGRAA